MKIIKRLLVTLTLFVLASYSIFTTMRLHQLEMRPSRVENTQPSANAPFTYAFDNTFIQHFGQQGVDAVNQAVRRGFTEPDQIVHDAARQLGL